MNLILFPFHCQKFFDFPQYQVNKLKILHLKQNCVRNNLNFLCIAEKSILKRVQSERKN